MAGLSKRERVLRAIRFEETDRIPLYDIFQSDTIIEHYSREALTLENGDWVKGLAIGRVLDMTSKPEGPRFPGIERRDDGLVMQQERWSRWVAHRPFSDVEGAAEWIGGEISRINSQNYGPHYRDRLQDDVKRYLGYFAEGDPTGMRDPAVLAVESSVGLKEMYGIIGTDKFLGVISGYPGLVETWLDAINEAELRRIAAIANPEVFPVVVVEDHIVTKSGIAFAPDWLQVHFMPKLKRVVDAWHSRDTLVLFSSAGNLMQHLDQLLQTGIDGLAPLEGMPVGEVRRRSPNLFLAGGIDASQLLAFGMPNDVRKTCRETIIAAGRKGYFLGGTLPLDWEVQLDNVIAMHESSGQVNKPPAARRF